MGFVEEAGGDGKRRRGRPTTFNRHDALERAMRLFCEHGYEGTTFDQLADAMGISASSFYNAFGSKERLYEEAVALYLRRSNGWVKAALAADTDARTAFGRLLAAAAEQFTQCGEPSGCMLSLACTSVGEALDPLRDKMALLRWDTHRAMVERLQRSAEAGELPAGVDVDALAGFFGAVSRGMAMLARDGASLAQLQAIAAQSMAAWPGR